MEKEEYKKAINLLINQKNILIKSIKEIKNDKFYILYKNYLKMCQILI